MSKRRGWRSDVVRVGEWQEVEQEYWGNDPLQDGIQAASQRQRRVNDQDSGVSDSMWEALKRKVTGGE